MTDTQLSRFTWIPRHVTGVVQTPNKDSGVHATRRETVYQDHGWRRRDRLDGKTDIRTDRLAQVVERRADALAHGGHGRSHAKRPQTTVFSGQVSHRGEQGTRRVERVCYTCQLHGIMLRIPAARQIGHANILRTHSSFGQGLVEY